MTPTPCWQSSKCALTTPGRIHPSARAARACARYAQVQEPLHEAVQRVRDELGIRRLL